ncbi:MAG: bacteriocin transport accessory protein, partial [Clostridia bacterium]|nr:bacteriocin transport accessory protein [Clostridia bacterium]
AYKLKEGTDVAAFAADFEAGLNGRQWMCGFPEKFAVIQTGSFVVTAFGNGQIIDLFKTKAMTLENAVLVLEGAIAA